MKGYYSIDPATGLEKMAKCERSDKVMRFLYAVLFWNDFLDIFYVLFVSEFGLVLNSKLVRVFRIFFLVYIITKHTMVSIGTF